MFILTYLQEPETFLVSMNDSYDWFKVASPQFLDFVQMWLTDNPINEFSKFYRTYM